MVYLQRWHWLVPHETAAVSAQVLCTPYNHAPCHFMQSHIRKVHACLAVTCHLHFWQNDQARLRTTADIKWPLGHGGLCLLSATCGIQCEGVMSWLASSGFQLPVAYSMWQLGHRGLCCQLPVAYIMKALGQGQLPVAYDMSPLDHGGLCVLFSYQWHTACGS